MAHYLLLVKDHRDQEGRLIKAREVFENRVQYRFWSFNKRAGNLKKLKCDDLVLFYVAEKGGLIVGKGALASDPYPISNIEYKLALGLPSKNFDYIVDLKNIEVWPVPVEFKRVYEKLSFIKDKSKPYVYLQGSIKRLSEEDYNFICNLAKETSLG